MCVSVFCPFGIWIFPVEDTVHNFHVLYIQQSEEPASIFDRTLFSKYLRISITESIENLNSS